MLCAWGALVAIALWIAPVQPGHSVCWFKEATRLPCPACGSSRAVFSLASGHAMEAFVSNPLLVTAGAAMMSWLLLRLVTRRRFGLQLSKGEQWAAWAAGVLALAANWAFLIRQGR